MSDSTENNTENTDQGVERMSIEDAINFSQTGQKPVTEAVESTETTEEAVAETEETITPETATPEASETTTEKGTPETTTEETVTAETQPVAETEQVEDKAKEVKDPYADILDDEDRAYLNFKKNNPGTTRADYEDSKVDYEKLDRKDLLRRKLREKYNLNDSDTELDEYIETELGIPMGTNESEMSLTERVSLRKHTDDYVQAKKAQHEKWAENANKTEETAQTEPQEDMVQLEDGSSMPKAEYQKLVDSRNAFVKNNEDTLNRVKDTSFSMTVDDNGEKRDLNYSYEYDEKDKHRVLSIVNDAQQHFNSTYQTEEGYDHDALAINKSWEDPTIRIKMLTSFAQQIRAEAIEEVLKDQGNVTLGTKRPLPPSDTPGVKMMSFKDIIQNN